jgi:hypothetical protein
MNHKTLVTTCGRKINIFQNVFPIFKHEFFISYAQNSFYKIGRKSGNGSTDKPGNFFSCNFTDEDDYNFGLNNTPEVKNILGNAKRRCSWINSTITGSWYYSHVDWIDNGRDDKEYVTLLFNINRFWDTEHGGETLFYNIYGEKEIAVDFIPGQIIVFDSRLAHKPALSDGNTEPRYIYVSIYEKGV